MTESNTRGLERDPTDSSTAPGSISNAVPTDSHATDLIQFQLNTLTILEVVGKVERSNLALIDDGATVIEDDDGDYKLVQPADDGGEE